MTTGPIQFDAQVAHIYDETRPIDKGAIRECIKDALIVMSSQRDLKIVEVGCGTGRILESIIPDVFHGSQVVGIDTSTEMLSVARKKRVLANVALEQISAVDFANRADNHQCFDVVICHWLFHCLVDWQETLRACTRLTKKSGILLWLQEESVLYKALDGRVCHKADRTSDLLKLLFDYYYGEINKTLTPPIEPASRSGTMLRCTDTIENELHKWGWEVQFPGETRCWARKVSVDWIIKKVLTPRAYTNLRRIPHDINENAILEMRKCLGRGRMPKSQRQIPIEFQARVVVACAQKRVILSARSRSAPYQLWSWVRSRRSWFWLRSRFITIEPTLRTLAEKRGFFIPAAAVCTVLAVSGIWLNHWLYDLPMLLLTTVGFFYAIYAIKGLLERPHDLDEVLIRTTGLIKRFLKKENCTAILLCEYPAWGALSSRHAPSYWEFSNALTDFLQEGSGRKLVLVAPSISEMQKRITLYAQDYGRAKNEEEAAVEANKTLVGSWIARRNASQCHFKHWEVDDVPRYQMLLIAREVKTGRRNKSETDELALVPQEAIVWFAPRSSDANVDLGGRKKADYLWTDKEVQVLAWQTTDAYILKELYDSACFYVNRYCQTCNTYGDLLGVPY